VKKVFELSTKLVGMTFAMILASFLIGDITSVSAAPPKEKKCEDGVDNDGDGLIDAADPDCSAGSGGGNTGNGQDTPADVYIYNDATFGIRGDQVFTGGDSVLNPGGVASLYPANNLLPGTYSCASAIVTDQAQGYVRMFVPSGTTSGCTEVNRFLVVRSEYDLDQDGFCIFPYTGRRDATGFRRFYECTAPEVGNFEEIMGTVHLDSVLGPDGTTSVGIQVRILDYGDDYDPTVDGEPTISDIEFIGSQERAFNIELQAVTTSVPDGGDSEVRVFQNMLGTATMCQVEWRNGHAKECKQIVDGNGDPVVFTGLTVKGKVDPTPIP